MLWLLLLLLPLGQAAVFPYAFNDFLFSCQRKNNNGVCDFNCRNFFPEAEQSDCIGYEMRDYNISLQFSVDEISFAGILFNRTRDRHFYCDRWRKDIERLMREAVQVEVQLTIPDEKLFDIGRKCYEEELVSLLVELPFTFSLAICSECPFLDDILGRLATSEEVTSGKLSYVPPAKKNSTLKAALVGICAIALLAVGCATVVVTTSRRRKIVSAKVWIPSLEKMKQDDCSYSYQTPAFHSGYYENYIGMSPNQSISQNQKPDTTPVISYSDYTVDSQITDLHLLLDKEISEQEMVRIAEKLVRERCVNINAVTDKAETAVNLAVRKGKMRVVECLLNLGADGSFPDRSGYSLLHHAVSLMDIEMLKLLLRYPSLTTDEYDERGGQQIDVVSYSGKTALMECAVLPSSEEVGVEMARLLIKAGASVSVQGEKDYSLHNTDYIGKTALHYAAETDNLSMISLLVETAPEKTLLLNILDFHNKTALYYACKWGQINAVKLLMKLGANQYLPVMEPSSFPIQAALAGGYEDIVKLLDSYKNLAKESQSRPNKYAVKKSNERKRSQSHLLSPTSSTSSSPSQFSQSPPTNTNSPTDVQQQEGRRTSQDQSYHLPQSFAYFNYQFGAKDKFNLSPLPYFSTPPTDESTP